MEQTKFAKNVYLKLGSEGLAGRTDKKRTAATVNKMLTYLKKKDKILDLACGYGRVTIPLAKKGFDIQGIDISSNLIKKAKEDSRKSRLMIEFKVGDMRKLPYKDRSFDKIICLWSAFNELIAISDQKKCVNEVYRVLRPGGLCVMELIDGESDWWKEKKLRNNIFSDNLEGTKIKVKHYIHTRKTLNLLAKSSEFSDYKAEIKALDGRNRLFFILKR